MQLMAHIYNLIIAVLKIVGSKSTRSQNLCQRPHSSTAFSNVHWALRQLVLCESDE
jgi:hypothetical protein